MVYVSLLAAFVSASLTVYLILKTVWSKTFRLRYPPAMSSIPVFGSLPFIADRANPQQTFAEKAKQLGSVFSCYIGSRYTVILNDRQSIREAFLKRSSAFSDRDVLFVMKTYLHPIWKGISHHAYDAEFTRHKKCIFGILKDFGLGQMGMVQRIQCEIEELIQHLREVDGKTFDPREIVHNCILNFIYIIMFGKKTPQTDPDLKRLSSIIRKTTAAYPAIVDLFPPLRFIPYYRNCIQKAVSCMKEQKQVIAEMIKVCLENETKETSLIAAFVEKEGPDYEPGSLTELVRGLMFAGSDTSTFTVLWSLFLLANNPEVQKRLHDEMDSVVPSDRLPCCGDMSQLPLMDATVLEIMRFKTLVPLALPHKAMTDTEVAGYYIPKDTTILPNFYAVHMNKDEWGDPEVFRPERFLDESGKVVGRDRLMPFSIGKRSCMGEGIARPEIFMFVSSLVQQFDVYPATGKAKVECQENTYLITRSSGFEIRMVPRKINN